MKDTITRTFSISKNIYERLNDCAQDFGITKNTIMRMAIYHGIALIDNGYVPMRDHKKCKKQKVKISMPSKCWRELYEIQEKNAYVWNEKIPDGELITLFIEMELDKYDKIVKYDSDFEDKWKEDFEEGVAYNEHRTITVKIPDELGNVLNSKMDFAGVSEIQFWKYIIAQGIMQEYNMLNYDFIHNDADVICEIKKLGLDKIKTMTLLKYLRENGRISFNMGKWNGNWEKSDSQNEAEE